MASDPDLETIKRSMREQRMADREHTDSTFSCKSASKSTAKIHANFVAKGAAIARICVAMKTLSGTGVRYHR